MIVVNFKTYKRGKGVINLAKKISKVDKHAILCVQAGDIFPVSKAVKNPVYAQHIDFKNPGRNTGFILPEAVRSAGAKGSLLNHSEHSVNFKIIKETVSHCKKIGFNIIISPSLAHVKKLMKLRPYAIAYEDPYLVGTGRSITNYQTKNVEEFAKM